MLFFVFLLILFLFFCILCNFSLLRSLLDIFGSCCIISYVLLFLGLKLDREKEKLRLELEKTEKAELDAMVKKIHLRKVLRQLKSQKKEMFERELSSIEEQERIESIHNSDPIPEPPGPLLPSLMSPDWNQNAAEMGFADDIP